MFMTSSGVECKDLSRGSGEPATRGDRVVVHYTGWLADGTQFDSSRGSEPFAFKLGVGEVIAGWDEGLVGQQVGQAAIKTSGRHHHAPGSHGGRLQIGKGGLGAGLLGGHVDVVGARLQRGLRHRGGRVHEGPGAVDDHATTGKGLHQRLPLLPAFHHDFEQPPDRGAVKLEDAAHEVTHRGRSARIGRLF